MKHTLRACSLTWIVMRVSLKTNRYIDEFGCKNCLTGLGVLVDDLNRGTKQTLVLHSQPKSILRIKNDEVDADIVHDTAEEGQLEDSTVGIEISTAPIHVILPSESNLSLMERRSLLTVSRIEEEEIEKEFLTEIMKEEEISS
ncbi:hypothetical protein Tco_0291581 [Tanacetum coccineum]